MLMATLAVHNSRTFARDRMLEVAETLTRYPNNFIIQAQAAGSLNVFAESLQTPGQVEQNITDIDALLEDGAEPEATLTAGVYFGDDWQEFTAKGRCLDDVLASVSCQVEDYRKKLAGAAAAEEAVG